ncbi:hypothetical protein MG293_011580 [Ovis ammon polii]|uniref:Uncharacterized protein n=1 Tax=Ovis ammon polii TaxID=230172 RepID=A0AAD4U4K2_OVIAM|nr:hypothetical protein MG293_011580 [Ovis ammon polii]
MRVGFPSLLLCQWGLKAMAPQSDRSSFQDRMKSSEAYRAAPARVERRRPVTGVREEKPLRTAHTRSLRQPDAGTGLRLPDQLPSTAPRTRDSEPVFTFTADPVPIQDPGTTALPTSQPTLDFDQAWRQMLLGSSSTLDRFPDSVEDKQMTHVAPRPQFRVLLPRTFPPPDHIKGWDTGQRADCLSQDLYRRNSDLRADNKQKEHVNRPQGNTDGSLYFVGYNKDQSVMSLIIKRGFC